MRLSWPPIIERAAEIVESYQGGVTLRQLFYRLVSEGLIPNSNTAYKSLSSNTARERREGNFPSLVDHTRQIHAHAFWTSPKDILEAAADGYQLDRTEGQEFALYLGAEKATMQSLLDRWFGELGLPVLLLRGYGSQTYLDDIADHALSDGRQPVMIYAGDLDPSGEDIERDFAERTGLDWDLLRIAVTIDQVDDLGLVRQPGKRTDSRAPAFEAKYGDLFQVEVEAIEPDALRGFYQAALDRFWDEDAYGEVMETEREHRERLREFAATFDADS